jgi:type I restriction enzyme, S subunit
MSKLPDGWVETPLESVVEILDSRRVPVNAKEREKRIAGKEQSELYPYYGATGQVGFIDDYIFDEPLILLGEDGVPFLDPMRPKAYLIDGKYWVNNHAHVLKAIDGTSDRRYLCAFLNTYDYSQKVTGTTRLKLTQEAMRAIKVPLAPLPEQKRIADKLDALLARVEQCQTHLDRVPALLKAFRQSVLAAATSGRLTEEWREENSVIGNWRLVKLSDVATSRLGKMLDAAKNRGELRPYLRNINVRWFDFDLNNIQELRISDEEAKTLTVRKGDVLVCEGGEPGRCAVWHGEDDRYLFQKALHRIRVGEKLLPEWICYSLKAAADSGSLADYFTGTTIKHFTGVSLSQFEFGLPSIEEQHEIVRRVERLFAFAERLEARWRAAQGQVSALTPSLLAKAFRGELVGQNPEDEPAKKLLERILAQRAAQPVQAKRERKSREIRETKMTEDTVKEAIRQLPDEKFSFDELRERFPGDYEQLKLILFKLLDEPQPIIDQVFDQSAKAMRFVRRSQ